MVGRLPREGCGLATSLGRLLYKPHCALQVVQGNSTYASMLGLILAQFDGLVAGYQARHAAADDEKVPPLSKKDFLFVNGNGT